MTSSLRRNTQNDCKKRMVRKACITRKCTSYNLNYLVKLISKYSCNVSMIERVLLSFDLLSTCLCVEFI